ncbi:MAG: TerC family protein [Acidobacteria bacterium]|nr:TerC family protein [Acidobacteriota bacterium]
MFHYLITPGFWLSLFSVTLVQIALGADNLIVITIIATKLPAHQRVKAINLGLILAMVFRIVLLAIVSWVLDYATAVFMRFDTSLFGWLRLQGALSWKAVLLTAGGLFLIWKGIKELRLKSKGVEQEIPPASKLAHVVALIVGLNLLFSIDSILSVVGMTDHFIVMAGSVVISVALMMAFVTPLSRFLSENPDFEILGLFVLLFIGFVLFLEGGHVADVIVNGSSFPYIPNWIVIFTLMLMFSVDLYQNWVERRHEKAPIELRRRKK